MTKDDSHIKYDSLYLNGHHYVGVSGIQHLTEQLKASKSEEHLNIAHFLDEWTNNNDTIALQTSGSTGTPKQIMVKKKSMIASAKKTIKFLGLSKADTALLCLSAKYIAGKMMIVRALVGQLNLIVGNVSSDPLANIDREIDFAAMVPMQVSQLMEKSPQSLKRIKHLIIGGGNLNKNTIEHLKRAGVNAWETYGMTETVSHIALRSIHQYNEGFKVLPNIRISTDDRQCLVVEASDVNEQTLITNDIVEIDASNHFVIKGRYDNVINSGGVKLMPEEIEAKLQKQIPFEFIISSKEDEVLGQKLVLVLELKNKREFISPDYSELNRFEAPKEVVYIDEFPRTETGKLHRYKIKLLLK